MSVPVILLTSNLRFLNPNLGNFRRTTKPRKIDLYDILCDTVYFEMGCQ